MAAPDARYDILLSNDRTLDAWDARDELLVSNHWTDVMLEEHATGFTVARVANLDLLGSIRASLDDVIRNGGTFEQWKANILPELKKHGWWGVVTDKKITGSDKPVIINERRLENIYRTNVKMSMAAGRWKRIQSQKDVLPYLRYLSDHFRKHPRQDHKSWHGLILHVDDPAWQWLFPPNGWGCNCRVQQLNQAMMDRRGWKVGTAPERSERDFVRASTGEIIQVPEGIAPGFGYNPGTAHLQAIADKSLSSILKLEQAQALPSARAAITDIVGDAAFEQFAALPNSSFPFAVLPEQVKSAVQSKTAIVRFSRDQMEKQNRKHPHIDLGHYRELQSIIDNAPAEDWRIEKTGNGVAIVLLHFRDGKWWNALFKPTQKRDELYFLTLHELRPNQLEARRALPILSEEEGDAR